MTGPAPVPTDGLVDLPQTGRPDRRTRLDRLDRWTQPAVARLRRVPPWLVLVAALAVTTGVWWVLQRVEPYLGHDESVYAGRGRAWVTGAPATGWESYRPVGLPALAYAALHVSDSTVAVRVVGLVLALGTLAAVHLVAARVVGPRRAAVSTLVVLSGVTFLRRLPEFLDDIPAAGLLLVVAYLVLRSRRPGGRWALPAAAAVAVPTLLVRYGASAGLLAIAGAAVLVWGPRSWLRSRREVVAAVGVLAAGLAPVGWYSRQVTGSWLGVLTRAEAVGHRDYLGQGLVDYARAYPAKLAGVLGAVVVTAGLVSLVLRARRLRTTTRAADRELVFLGTAGVLELLLLGLSVHGESRFALFTVITLTVVGVDAIAVAAGRRAAVAVAAVGAAALVATAVTAVLVDRQVATATAPVTAVGEAASRAVAGEAGAPCLVVVPLAPEAAWASGCQGARPDDVTALAGDLTVYLLEVPQAPGGPQDEARIRALDPRRTWSVHRLASSGQLADAVVAVSRPPT